MKKVKAVVKEKKCKSCGHEHYAIPHFWFPALQQPGIFPGKILVERWIGIYHKEAKYVPFKVPQ